MAFSDRRRGKKPAGRLKPNLSLDDPPDKARFPMHNAGFPMHKMSKPYAQNHFPYAQKAENRFTPSARLFTNPVFLCTKSQSPIHQNWIPYAQY